MNETQKAGLSVLAGCTFAIWGASLNAYIPEWLLRWHYDVDGRTFYSSDVPMLFGFLFGIITSTVFFYQNATLSIWSGFIFLFMATLFFCFGLPFETPLLARFDNYGLCFLWAISLIAIGYILRSRPKNDVT